MTKEQLQEMHKWLLEKITESSAGPAQKAVLETRLNDAKNRFERGVLPADEFTRILAQVETEIRAHPAPDLLAAIQSNQETFRHIYESIGLVIESVAALQRRMESLEKRVLALELRH